MPVYNLLKAPDFFLIFTLHLSNLDLEKYKLPAVLYQELSKGGKWPTTL